MNEGWIITIFFYGIQLQLKFCIAVRNKFSFRIGLEWIRNQYILSR